jgi:hypothetical protein
MIIINDFKFERILTDTDKLYLTFGGKILSQGIFEHFLGYKKTDTVGSPHYPHWSVQLMSIKEKKWYIYIYQWLK